MRGVGAEQPASHHVVLNGLLNDMIEDILEDGSVLKPIFPVPAKDRMVRRFAGKPEP